MLFFSQNFQASITSDNGFWYRAENTEGSNKVSKNNNKGPYYEYTRTLNFYTFGAENNIDIEQLKINSQIPYEYDIFISVAEKSGSEYIEYKAENTTGEKKISVVLKIYTNEMDDTINKEIIENIEKSYFEYNGHKIHLTDGTIKEELRK